MIPPYKEPGDASSEGLDTPLIRKRANWRGAKCQCGPPCEYAIADESDRPFFRKRATRERLGGRRVSRPVK